HVLGAVREVYPILPAVEGDAGRAGEGNASRCSRKYRPVRQGDDEGRALTLNRPGGNLTGWPPRGLPGQFRAPLQLHRGLNRLDALASRSNGLTERSPEPLISFDQARVLSGAAIGGSDTSLFFPARKL